MSDKDLNLSKLELLRMARELVINEYIDRRAQDHNKWIADADVAWRTQGIKLPYPAFPIYPSETEIITRANALNEFLNKDSTSVVKGTEEKIQAEPEPEKPKMTPVIIPMEPEIIPKAETITTAELVTTPNVYVMLQNTPTTNVTAVVNEEIETKTNSILSKFDQLKATWGIK